MRKTEMVSREMTHEVLLALVCDKCGREEEFNPYEPSVKGQVVTVGYATEDSTLHAAEFCQDCMQDLLGEYLRVVEVPNPQEG